MIKYLHVFALFFVIFAQNEATRVPNNSDKNKPLILTPYLLSKQIQEAKRLSQVQHHDLLKGIPHKNLMGIKSYSGYLTVNENFNSNMFFWFFPSENDFVNDPVILYLQGGPGFSTMYTIFQENGPFIVTKNKVSLRDVRLTKNHSVIYVDNPVGTGFSFTNNGYTENDTEVGEQLYNALEQFFTMFPELRKNDFWIVGESYAGKFIPALGSKIHQQNLNSNVKINLKGLIMSDAFIQPIDQIDFGEYAYRVNLIDDNTRNRLNKILEDGKKDIRNKNFQEAGKKAGAILEILNNETAISSLYNYLVMEDQNKHFKLIGDQDWINFLNKNNTKQAIHVGTDIFYQSFQPIVTEKMLLDNYNSAAPWLSELLNHYRVLLFNGQLDVEVPYYSLITFLKNFQFAGADEYKQAKRFKWMVGEDLAGYCKKAGLLQECLVRNTGHLVPFDQPEYALDLVSKFIRNIPLSSN